MRRERYVQPKKKIHSGQIQPREEQIGNSQHVFGQSSGLSQSLGGKKDTFGMWDAMEISNRQNTIHGNNSLSLSLSLYIYIYICICMYVYIYIYTHTQTHKHIHMYVLYAYVYVYMYVHTHALIHTKTHAPTHLRSTKSLSDPKVIQSIQLTFQTRPSRLFPGTQRPL